MKHVLFIALVGAGGALARYWLQNLMRGSALHLPLGTLTVNVLGSFLAGVVYVLVAERATLHPDWRSVMVVGFLGAFTTFPRSPWRQWCCWKMVKPRWRGCMSWPV